MRAGYVVGTATTSIKHSSMNGQKLLIVQPCMEDGKTPDGDPLVAIDAVGAGRGEMVIITSDGRFAREMLGVDATPVRWSVIGIADA
ncbi:MAG: microcompartment protein CcmK/EutM [Pirellulaceae bacterium]|jgi:microcompartment protein CcmK/EutM